MWVRRKSFPGSLSCKSHPDAFTTFKRELRSMVCIHVGGTEGDYAE